MGKSINRREFIGQSVAAGLGASIIGKTLLAKQAEKKWLQKPATIIKVTHSKALDAQGNANQDVIHEMIKRAICEFTQTNDDRDAWLHFIDPKDTVGLKINTLGLRPVARTIHTSHFHAVTEVIRHGLEQIGVKPSEMLIWDMRDGHLKEAGFNPDVPPEEGALRCLSAQANEFDEQTHTFEGVETRVTKILTQQTSAMISIPLAKSHRISGVTGALKMHYGTIQNPRDFHANNCCKPGIADINTIPVIKEKTRLILMDALYTVIDGGPSWNPPSMRQTKSILVATDPVALDRIMLESIEALRLAEKLEPLTPMSEHIKIAGELGLGEYDREKINLVEINLG